jgi:predicted O-methyltransferase YrrM
MAGLLHHSPSPTRGRRVFLAVPAYGQVPPLFAFSLFKSHTALRDAGFDVELGILTGNCHVDDARNRLVRDFLKSDCEDFVFIDSDMGWQPSDLVRLLSYDRDVVGGTYPLKQNEEGFPVKLIPGEIWSDRDGLIEVDGLPTGFLRIRRNVLQTLFARAQKYKIKGSDDQEEMALIFERTIVNGGRVSGDYSFCRKWRAIGGKIYLDPDCYMEHVGEKTWSGVYASYLRRKNGLAMSQGLNKVFRNKADAKTYLEMTLDWGNDPFSAGIELLAWSADVARKAQGPILEAGSGLSSLVMAAANPKITVHCLESSDEWARKLQDAAQKLEIQNLVIHRCPLVNRWYSAVDVPWKAFDVVVCDGPKRSDGDREILLSEMDKHGCHPKVVLVDDAVTEAEPFKSWAGKQGYEFKVIGKLRQFAVATRNEMQKAA